MVTRKLTDQVRSYLSTLSAEDDVLVKERDIAKKFDTNHGHARRILITLESEGLLRCIPRRGYQLVDYSRTEVQSMYRVRVAIEAEAARQAAKRADREDMVRMSLILEESESDISSDRYAKLDKEFHQALVNASKDNLLIRLFEFIVVLRVKNAPERETAAFRKATMEGHRRILDAIKRRDYRAADKAVMRHLGSDLAKRDARDRGTEAPTEKTMQAAWRQRGGAEEDTVTEPVEESGHE